MGTKFEETWGKYEGVPERSLIVHGLPREQLYSLGQKYGQESVIHAENGQHQFLYTHGPKEGTMHLGDPAEHQHWPEGHPAPPDDNWTRLPQHGHLRLGFDWGNSHVITPGQPGVAPQPAVAQPMQQGAPTQPPVTKHEIGHALYQVLQKKLQENLEAAHNLTAQESSVAEEKKALSTHEALHELYKGFKGQIVKFEEDCLSLRKAELKKGLEEGTSGMEMSEPEMKCESCGMKKAADHDCDSDDKMEKWAKGELDPVKKDQMEESEDDKMEKWAKAEMPIKKGDMPAGASPDYPGKKIGVLPDDKKPKELEGTDQDAKPMKKAGLPMGGAAPKAPGAPAAGGAPKLPGAGKPAAGGMPKLPGPPKPAAAGGLPKPAMGAAGKPPAMGAGQPSLKAEKPMVKNFGPGSVLHGSPGAVMGAGPVHGGLPKPAAPVKTMVERIAAKVPQGPSLPGSHLFSKPPGK